jgi:agmatine/peptidylarginine deiminase
MPARFPLSKTGWLPTLTIAAILMAMSSIIPALGVNGHPRIAAEWEPALGALVVWPPIVPDSLLVEIARDDRLFVMVADQEEKTEAESKLKELGIDLGSVELIIDESVGFYAWPRDFGPHALFDQNGDFQLADPKFVGYPSSMPHCDSPLYEESSLWDLFGNENSDPTAAELAKRLNVPSLSLPFALTGGNALVDGHGTAFSTCVMMRENQEYFGLTQEEFFRAVETQLGIKNYVIVPNFEWFGIQHIDCLLKPLDEETLLVKRLPEGHPDHEPIEEIVKTLSGLMNPYGRPYRIPRIDTPPYFMGHYVANYTNSLILNRKVLVPLFGIPADERALATFRELMPGYEVIGFENEGRWGWNWLDALHCRVRAVWDPKMLYMSHKRIDDRVRPAESYPVEVLIRDYSRAGLIDEELKLSWRLRGETGWHEASLVTGSSPGLFVAAIPAPDDGATVEYFFSAADRSGRRETLPRVAPGGFYSFKVDSKSN